MRFILDGGSVGSRQALHQTLAAGLRFPDWYGGNLDALHDCLTDITEPTELVIRGGAALAGWAYLAPPARFHARRQRIFVWQRLKMFARIAARCARAGAVV